MLSQRHGLYQSYKNPPVAASKTSEVFSSSVVLNYLNTLNVSLVLSFGSFFLFHFFLLSFLSFFLIFPILFTYSVISFHNFSPLIQHILQRYFRVCHIFLSLFPFLFTTYCPGNQADLTVLPHGSTQKV